MLHEQGRGYGRFEPDRAHQRAQLGKGLPWLKHERGADRLLQ